jgi:subtilase family serine protease
MKASPLGILAGALLSCAALAAQNSTIAPRITTDVDESSLTTLKGNVPHRAQAQYDQGEASASTQLTHMRLVLSRTSEQQAALDQYLAQLQDKSSPNYHKWLTPEQFGKLYGPADSDVAALVAWLESHGFQVEPVSAGRTNIAFSGSVSQVEEAFHTSIHSFQTNDAQFTSNTTDPQIPSALASVVKGVAHLNTIRPRPHSVRGNAGRADPQTKRMEPASAVSANKPRAGLTDTSGGDFLYIVPADAATIYDTPNAFNAAYSGTGCGSSSGCTGAGVKIGIGGDATIIASIVGTYRSTFLGSSYATSPTLNYCTSSSSCSATPGSGYVADDADEAYLDTELSSGLAPGASIYYYASTDLNTGIEAALDANLVDIFSLSFGECEYDNGTSGNALINGWWEQAATQGIAVTVSTGDSGSASCDGDTAKTTTIAKDGLSVSGFASTPYDIAVGGTDFYALEGSFTSYVSATLGSSSTYYRTVLSYIPESIWNDSVVGDTNPFSENVPETGKYASIVAGSGGVSSCATLTAGGSCLSGYSKPAWQRGTGVPQDGARDVPDVSLMSGNGYDYATWLVCDDDTGENFSSTNTTLNCSSISAGDFDGFGGTSTAAPAFAGMLALVQQKAGSRLGQAAAVLYNLYNGSHSSSIFHDVTVGNNSVPCKSGSSNCIYDSVDYYFENGYNAAAGYDLASGLGSVDVTQLITYWNTANGTATATVAVKPQYSSITTADSLSVPVTVTGSSTAPTGTVTLSGGTYTSAAETLSTSGTIGSYTFAIPAGDLSVGNDTITATYNADGTYAMAIGTATVTVTSASSGSGTYTLAATTPAAIAPGASTTSTLTVSSSNSYAGSVALTCALTSYPTGATYLPSCSINPTTVTLSSSTASGTATVTLNTTAATSAALASPKLPGKGRGWAGAGGGAVLAFLVFLGIPARRRSWRSMLGVLLVMAALGSLTACGSGGSTTTSTGTPGTTAGTYTFTVTGTGTPSVTPAPTTTFTVTVT